MPRPPCLVTCYPDPDMDGAACAVAYATLLASQGRPARAGITGVLQLEPRWVFACLGLAPPAPPPAKIADIILVDASEPAALPPGTRPEQVLEIIDHRQAHAAALFPNAATQIDLVGAAATIVWERFQTAGIQPPHGIGLLLAAAIASNTLNFRAGTTTARDHAAADGIAARYPVPPDFIQGMFQAKSVCTGMRLRRMLQQSLATVSIGSRACAICQLELLGSRTLVRTRLPEIQTVLEDLRQRHRVDWIFLSLVALDEEVTRLVSTPGSTQIEELLADTLAVTFRRSLAEYPRLVLRKELVPLLQGAAG